MIRSNQPHYVKARREKTMMRLMSKAKLTEREEAELKTLLERIKS